MYQNFSLNFDSIRFHLLELFEMQIQYAVIDLRCLFFSSGQCIVNGPRSLI